MNINIIFNILWCTLDKYTIHGKSSIKHTVNDPVLLIGCEFRKFKVWIQSPLSALNIFI